MRRCALINGEGRTFFIGVTFSKNRDQAVCKGGNRVGKRKSCGEDAARTPNTGNYVLREEWELLINIECGGGVY